jgi:hypothetical protein
MPGAAGRLKSRKHPRPLLRGGSSFSQTASFGPIGIATPGGYPVGVAPATIFLPEREV